MVNAPPPVLLVLAEATATGCSSSQRISRASEHMVAAGLTQAQLTGAQQRAAAESSTDAGRISK